GDRSGDRFTELRTYHSTWPYTGQHTFRAPPLPGRTPEPIPAVFARYIEWVSQADVAAILDAFTHDGYVREPSGKRWKHQGPEARQTFYAHLTSAPRATFALASCTTDANQIAVEYAFSYGDVPMVGGICIMEVDGDAIAAVRITDDVEA
ncbi:MAG: nuclear transport factor 2 family protein, partial [Myxococcota bacterium]